VLEIKSPLTPCKTALAAFEVFIRCRVFCGLFVIRFCVARKQFLSQFPLPSLVVVVVVVVLDRPVLSANRVKVFPRQLCQANAREAKTQTDREENKNSTSSRFRVVDIKKKKDLSLVQPSQIDWQRNEQRSHKDTRARTHKEITREIKRALSYSRFYSFVQSNS